MALIQIKKPYLLFVGDTTEPRIAKTAFGLRDWARDECIGQWRLSAEAVDLGLRDLSPSEAVAAGACTLVVGIAPPGGRIPPHWRATFVEALNAGLDLAAGMHERLGAINELSELAERLGRMIHDVRHFDGALPVGSGRRRPGLRLLTVGTDCALGKKYTALAIAKLMRDDGLDADFRATGQTGILISGGGISVDAVVADFISGAAEMLSPENEPRHWDIIEGQGSLFHPAYAGVTLGLLHGSQPDALVLCHDPSRTEIYGFPHVPIVAPSEALGVYLQAARLTNPQVRFVGVSLNTVTMTEADAQRVLAETAADTGLPCVDPMRTGVDAIVAMLRQFSE